MIIRALITMVAALGLAFGQGGPEMVGPSAVIEAIRFDGVAAGEQAAILSRIGVKQGDRLTSDARQTIGRRLNETRKPGALTFSYRTGTRAGTAVVVISAGC